MLNHALLLHGLTVLLSLVLGLRNQFHTWLLSAFFELLRRKHFLLFLLKPSSLLSPFHVVCGEQPAACCLPTCLPACLPAFHFKASRKANPHLCTHFLNTPEFHPVVQSGFCPLLACLGCPATHPDAVAHHSL